MGFYRAFVVIAAWLCFAFPALAESRVALVIGNGGYRAIGGLENPPNDAHDVGAALKALGFDVEIVVDADLAAMGSAVEAFSKKAEKADVSLFYYGGHGLQVSQHNFLVPVDAEFHSPDDITARTFPFDDVMQALAKGSGLRLVFLDACRNNPIKTFSLPNEGQGLAEVGKSAGFFIAYGTKPNFVAFDGAGRNSPFAQALLGHIATPGVDVSSLMIAVRRDVVAATGGEQVPWDSSSLTRSFYFAGGGGAVASTPEALLWQAAAKERDKSADHLSRPLSQGTACRGRAGPVGAGSCFRCADPPCRGSRKRTLAHRLELATTPPG